MEICQTESTGTLNLIVQKYVTKYYRRESIGFII